MGPTDLYLYLPPSYRHCLQHECQVYIPMKYLGFTSRPNTHRLPVLCLHGYSAHNTGRIPSSLLRDRKESSTPLKVIYNPQILFSGYQSINHHCTSFLPSQLLQHPFKCTRFIHIPGKNSLLFTNPYSSITSPRDSNG